MAVIPTTQLSLMRKRREFSQLMALGEWQKIIETESDLFTEIDRAVKDESRSSKELLCELSEVIKLYRQLSDACACYSKNYNNK